MNRRASGFILHPSAFILFSLGTAVQGVRQPQTPDRGRQVSQKEGTEPGVDGEDAAQHHEREPDPLHEPDIGAPPRSSPAGRRLPPPPSRRRPAPASGGWRSDTSTRGRGWQERSSRALLLGEIRNSKSGTRNPERSRIAWSRFGFRISSSGFLF